MGKKRGFSHDVFIDELPKAVKTELLYSITEPFVKNIELFQVASPELKSELISSLEALSFPPDTIITKPGEIGELFILLVKETLIFLRNPKLIMS